MSSGCARCGRDLPLRFTTFRRNVTLGIARVWHEDTGFWCRDCIGAVYWGDTLLTALIGWQGLISIVFGPLYIVTNTIEYFSSLSLPRAEGADAAEAAKRSRLRIVAVFAVGLAALVTVPIALAVARSASLTRSAAQRSARGATCDGRGDPSAPTTGGVLVLEHTPHGWRQRIDVLPDTLDPASSETTAAFTLCLGPLERAVVERCEYAPGASLRRMRLARDVKLVVARTGDVRVSTRIEGGDPGPCPPSSDGLQLKDKDGSLPEDDPDMWERVLGPAL